MFGPSEVLDLPNTLPMTIVGCCCLGSSVAFILVPLLSEIIHAVQLKENIGEDPELNDRASGIFNLGFATGSIIAPILGGTLQDVLGSFRLTCDVMGFSALLFSVIFFFLSTLPALMEKKEVKALVPIETEQKILHRMSRTSGFVCSNVRAVEDEDDTIVGEVFYNENGDNSQNFNFQMVNSLAKNEETMAGTTDVGDESTQILRENNKSDNTADGGMIFDKTLH